MNISSKMTGLALLAVSTASAQNLLVNSDFESGIDSWITFNNVEVSQDFAFDGSTSAKLFNPFCGADWCGSVLEQSTSCVPGQGYDGSIMTYVSSGDAFSAGSGNFLVLQVAFFDGAGNFLSLGESSQINIDSALDTWTELATSATAPANAATVKLVAVFVSPNGDPPNDLGAVFVDAASLAEGEATGPVCSFDTLENEGFESGFDCWEWFGNSFAVSDVYSQNGTGAAQVYGEFNGAENYSGFFQDFDTATPGDTVTFSGFAYSDGNDSIAGTTNRVVIKFDWVRADGSIDYGASAEVNITSGADPIAEDQWVPITISAVVPGDASLVRPAIVFVQGAENQGGSLWFDDFTFSVNGGENPCSNETFDNGSFEDGLGCWDGFGANRYASTNFALDGSSSLLMFGEFSGSVNYTGVTQDFTNVEVGDELSITASGYTPSDDSVLGNNNRVVIKWDFVDAGGNVIYAPTDSPLINGADPATPEDTWVENTHVTNFPPEAAGGAARAVILFVQEADEGGAVYIDAASVLINGEVPSGGGGGGPGPDTCPCDVDDDTICGFGDVLAVLSDWEGTDTDVDGDGTVGFGDVLAILSNWGPCEDTP